MRPKTSSSSVSGDVHDYDKLSKPPNLSMTERILLEARRRLWTEYNDTKRECVHTWDRLKRNPGAVRKDFIRYLRRKVFTVCTALIVVWMLLLWWGEVWLFDQAVGECQWGDWEAWPQGAAPHHVTLIADPQLVDPHTYPGRPWPLSTLTIKHTDLYLRRSYSRIQTDLDPDSILFLGDLFDGGREWSTRTSESPEVEYRKYGQNYWYNEFNRFSNIFFREWGNVEARERRDSRKIIASLPGNHDLGFGKGVQFPVKWRFQGWFGEGNRVDILGNHTFVSLDTVSLSAVEATGAPFGIWSPTNEYLQALNATRIEAIERHLNHLYNTPYPPRTQDRSVADLGDPDTVVPQPMRPPPPPLASKPKHSHPFAKLPTILLTHVPLYRPAGTPCGPLRERYPPSHDPPTFPDDPNSIPINAGYQYQNTISPTLTATILAALGGDLTNVFSGDDHDYCSVLHELPSLAGNAVSGMEEGRIQEITVKSISWAMGVRRPGFLLVSLLNPIDREGRPLIPVRGDGEDGSTETVHTHLCLLPDQLAIFVRYGVLLAVTILVLLIRAIALVAIASDIHESLPYSLSPSRFPEKSEDELKPTGSSTSYPSSNVLSRVRIGTVASPVSVTSSPASLTPNGDAEVDGIELWKPKRRQGSRKRSDAEESSEDDWATGSKVGRSELRGCMGVIRNWVGSVWVVTKVVVVWYVFLLFW